ncbi:MAG TPA: hypothetical protein VLB86_06425 [Gaiellaceae bacterium]|nr:hypothetical protein [Gaiellaceae bacterium]
MSDDGGQRNDHELIARRLGMSPELVRRLQARGALGRFDLSDAEIRRRLWAAQVRASGGAGPYRR